MKGNICKTHLRQSGLWLLALFFILVKSNAQNLELISPVLVTKANNDSINKFLLGTHNYNHVESNAKRYVNTLQIISANRPWPPLWYCYEPLYTNEQFSIDTAKGKVGYSQIGLPGFDIGTISYLRIQPSMNNDSIRSSESQFDFIFVVLDKQMNPIDTLKSPIIHGGKYGPGFKTNDKIEKLWVTPQHGRLDLSSITGDSKNKAVESSYYTLDVLDKNDKVKWSWNPIYHLPELFNVRGRIEQNKGTSPEKAINWLKIESWEWDYDGNILYCIRHEGGGLKDASVGKISRKDGHVIWKLDCLGEPTNKYKDSLVCFLPYGVKYVGKTDSTTIYSVYDQGGDTSSYARAILFEYNEKTTKLNLLKYITPSTKYWGNGHGGFEYEPNTGDYVFEYGVFEFSDTATTDFRNALEYGIGDSAHAVFQLPRENYTFGMHKLGDWPVPPRAVIYPKGKNLMASGTQKKWAWYSLEGPQKTTVKFLGNKVKVKGKPGYTYCAVGKYGTGYSVSEPYNVLSIKP